VSFVGMALDIDVRKPPRPRAETARHWVLWNESSTRGYLYDDLATVNADALEPFFQLLTVSPWAIPKSDLGDPSASGKVVDAIKFQHGIIQAQFLTNLRKPADVSNATLVDPKPGDNDAQPTFVAEVTAADARRRVVQDVLSTRVLQGLLGGTVLLLVVSWVFTRNTAVMASSPTTIAYRVALVAGGNLLELLPDNAQARKPDEMAAALGRDTRFRMGWTSAPGEDGKLSGTESEGGAGRFGIYGVRSTSTAVETGYNAGGYV